MVTSRRLVWGGVLAAAVMSAMACPRALMAAGPRSAAEFIGPPAGVELRATPASDWAPATPTSAVVAGMSVRTTNSSAQLRLPDGTVFRLAPATTLRMQVPTEISMDPGSNVRVSRCDLMAGEVALTIPPRAKPVLVMGGTDLFAAFRPGRARAVKNERGLTAVVDQGGARVASTGRWFTVDSGQYQVLPERGPVDPARQLGPVPVLSTDRCMAVGGRACAIAVVVGDGVARLGTTWTTRAPDQKFVVKLARDAAMTDVVETREVSGSSGSYLSEPLPAGKYWCEVRSVTPDGIVSEGTIRVMRVAKVEPEPGVMYVPADNAFVLPPHKNVGIVAPAGLVVSLGEGHSSPAPTRLSLLSKQTARTVLLGVQGSPHDSVPITLEARALEANIGFSPPNAYWPRDQIQVTIRLADPNHRVSVAHIRPHAVAFIENKRIALTLNKTDKGWTATLPQGAGFGPWIVRVQVTDDDGAEIGKAVLEVVHG